MVVFGVIMALAVLLGAIYVAVANWPKWAGLDPGVWRSCRYLGSVDADGRSADRGWLVRGSGAIAIMENGIRFRRAFSGFEMLIPADSVKSVELDAGRRGPSRSVLRISWKKNCEAVVSRFSVSASAEVTEEFMNRIGKLIRQSQ